MTLNTKKTFLLILFLLFFCIIGTAIYLFYPPINDLDLSTSTVNTPIKTTVRNDLMTSNPSYKRALDLAETATPSDTVAAFEDVISSSIVLSPTESAEINLTFADYLVGLADEQSVMRGIALYREVAAQADAHPIGRARAIASLAGVYERIKVIVGDQNSPLLDTIVKATFTGAPYEQILSSADSQDEAYRNLYDYALTIYPSNTAANLELALMYSAELFMNKRGNATSALPVANLVEKANFHMNASQVDSLSPSAGIYTDDEHVYQIYVTNALRKARALTLLAAADAASPVNVDRYFLELRSHIKPTDFDRIQKFTYSYASFLGLVYAEERAEEIIALLPDLNINDLDSSVTPLNSPSLKQITDYAIANPSSLEGMVYGSLMSASQR